MNFMLYHHGTPIRHVLVLAAALIQVTISSALAADKVLTKKTPTVDEKIQITADQLLSSSQEKYVEFIGNVEVHQGAFVIKSDRLLIYYKNLQSGSKNPAMDQDSIEKIIALGHVKIWSDDRVAETDQAEWSMTDRIIVLSGNNSKVTSGDNFITGSKITLYQVDGRIKVEGHNGQRVKATFYQGNKETTKGVEEKP
jgi:lipopolysaccharide export system protein LptA